MGTRSLTKIQDESGKVFTTFYRQFDGYPEGQGQTILDALGDAILVNGIPLGDPNEHRMVNGMGDAAIRVLLHMKLTGCYVEGNRQPTVEEQHAHLFKPGGIYIMHPDAKDCWEEWTYTIYVKDGKLLVRVEHTYEDSDSDPDGYGANPWYDGPINEDLLKGRRALSRSKKRRRAIQKKSKKAKK